MQGRRFCRTTAVAAAAEVVVNSQKGETTDGRQVDSGCHQAPWGPDRQGQGGGRESLAVHAGEAQGPDDQPAGRVGAASAGDCPAPQGQEVTRVRRACFVCFAFSEVSPVTKGTVRCRPSVPRKTTALSTPSSSRRKARPAIRSSALALAQSEAEYRKQMGQVPEQDHAQKYDGADGRARESWKAFAATPNRPIATWP